MDVSGGHFIPRERAPSIQWKGDWVGLRAILDKVVKRKIPSPCRESNPIIPIVQPNNKNNNNNNDDDDGGGVDKSAEGRTYG
jgi:hypothetical protein